MILTRSPLRISLGGGGTDLPSYYQEYGGVIIAAAINLYVYVGITNPFRKGIYLNCIDKEQVNSVEKIKHNIIREALCLPSFSIEHIEISSMADFPPGTGLGSSGSFTTALLKALYQSHHLSISPQELAELACTIEINKLEEPIGKQDQYIASYGGVTCFDFHPNNQVTASAMPISSKKIADLEDNLLLFFTGYTRSAGSMLADQQKKTLQADVKMLENLHFVKQLGYRIKEALQKENLEHFAELMHEHWEYKKARSPGMTNSKIDQWYKLACKNGALGGKLVGAGGGGCLLFYAADPDKLRHSMQNAGLKEVRFRFDFEGTKVLLT